MIICGMAKFKSAEYSRGAGPVEKFELYDTSATSKAG